MRFCLLVPCPDQPRQCYRALGQVLVHISACLPHPPETILSTPAHTAPDITIPRTSQMTPASCFCAPLASCSRLEWLKKLVLKHFNKSGGFNFRTSKTKPPASKEPTQELRLTKQDSSPETNSISSDDLDPVFQQPTEHISHENNGLTPEADEDRNIRDKDDGNSGESGGQSRGDNEGDEGSGTNDGNSEDMVEENNGDDDSRTDEKYSEDEDDESAEENHVGEDEGDYEGDDEGDDESAESVSGSDSEGETEVGSEGRKERNPSSPWTLHQLIWGGPGVRYFCDQIDIRLTDGRVLTIPLLSGVVWLDIPTHHPGEIGGHWRGNLRWMCEEE